MLKKSSWNGCRCLLLLTLTSLAGCGGCRPDDEKLSREEIEKRAKERSEALELSNLLTLPADSETKILMAKPGHWHQTQQQFKSNREDLQVVALGSVARGAELTTLPGTNVVNEFTRRTSFPKGQTKTVDLTFFVPFSGKQEDPLALVSSRLNFRTELLSVPLMTPILQSPSVMPANELKEHEFQLIAMGPEAMSYDYLAALDAVFWRAEDFMMEERTRSYYVSLVKPAEGKYSFPNTMLAMTAIAVIVWDDISPDDLSAAQQSALVDWVHWGGQLLVSGPSSWSRLQNSFLAPYLPAESASACEFTTGDFAQISNTWMVSDQALNAVEEPLSIAGAPIGGLQFNLGVRGSWLPGTGKMVAESQVGRGRIVLTSFPLREPRIYRWKYFSSFFSTGLLRRHPRLFRRSTGENPTVAQFWASPYDASERDPRMHSNVRILTRDLPLSVTASGPLEDKPELGMGGKAFDVISDQGINAPAAERGPGAEAVQWGGRGAAWNDYSGLSSEALTALKAAAGIELPTRRTILYLLAGYLACLVPLNWLLFRIVGRLEYAWIAAPIMALAGVIVVTKVARLDIGFARRTTEIAVLELHADYPRGHLTQYLALYSSLSTNYAIEFPENDSVALPLGDISRTRSRATAEVRNLRTNYGLAEGVVLEPLTVYSNSTEMVHAEQVVELDGGLRLGQQGAKDSGLPALKNETGLDLKAVLVVRRTDDDELELAWIGDLDSAQAAPLNYQLATPEGLWKNWRSDSVTQPDEPDEEVGAGSENDALWIGGVLKSLVSKTPLMPGQTRLFAYTNDRPSGLTVRPAEDQYDGRCVIVAHLSPLNLGDVSPDVNIMSRLTGPIATGEPLNELVPQAEVP